MRIKPEGRHPQLLTDRHNIKITIRKEICKLPLLRLKPIHTFPDCLHLHNSNVLSSHGTHKRNNAVRQGVEMKMRFQSFNHHQLTLYINTSFMCRHSKYFPGCHNDFWEKCFINNYILYKDELLLETVSILNVTIQILDIY